MENKYKNITEMYNYNFGTLLFSDELVRHLLLFYLSRHIYRLNNARNYFTSNIKNI